MGELCIGIQDHLDHHSMARPFLLVIIRECTTRVTGPLFMANLYLVHHLQFPHLCLQCIRVAVFLGENFFQYPSCYNAGRAGLCDVKLSNRPVIGVVYMQVVLFWSLVKKLNKSCHILKMMHTPLVRSFSPEWVSIHSLFHAQ